MSCSSAKDEGPRDGIAIEIPCVPYSSEECSLEVEECDGIVEEPSPPPPLCVPPEEVCNVEATNTGITPRHSSNRDYSGRRADDTTRLLTKILIPLAAEGILMVSEMKSFESVTSQAGVFLLLMSISLMVLGLNIKFKWLEIVGHMLFFIALMLVYNPIIFGPKHDPRFLWILPLVAALLFGSSVYFGSKNGVQFSSRNIAGTANFATVSGGAHSDGGERGRWRPCGAAAQAE